MPQCAGKFSGEFAHPKRKSDEKETDQRNFIDEILLVARAFIATQAWFNLAVKLSGARIAFVPIDKSSKRLRF
jgi:hypothetical protein